MHSALLAQPRHTLGLALRLQIGVVGVVQSAASFAVQPPQAPLGVHTAAAPGQLSGLARQASQRSVFELQIGVFPLQPALFIGSHCAQVPRTHCMPVEQSLASRHCTQLARAPSPTQWGVVPEHAAPPPQPHTRSLQVLAAVGEQPCPQSLQLVSVTGRHDPLQHSRLRPQSAWVSQAAGGALSSSPPLIAASVLDPGPGSGGVCASMGEVMTPASSLSGCAPNLSRSKSVTSEQPVKANNNQAQTERGGRGIA
jgi:hypothetical protein